MFHRESANNKTGLFAVLAALPVLLLSGCSAIGEKSSSVVSVYAVTTVLSLLLVTLYCVLVKKRDGSYLLLFGSVVVVNIGYLTLSVSQTLGEALLANRIAYLGSVFLPFAMLLIILDACGTHRSRTLVAALLALCFAVFLLAASPGYSTLYYKDVSLHIVNGLTTLQKTYGPLHGVYLLYLTGYFAAMLAVIFRAAAAGRIASMAMTCALLASVFVNIGIWLLEQLVYIEFEVLSLSYIMTELFLLCAHMMMQETDKMQLQTEPAEAPHTADVANQGDSCTAAELQQFTAGLSQLTRTERAIYDHYTAGHTTKEITAALNITENTLKFHNKNLYSKLGVPSRKELKRLHLLLAENGERPEA